MGYYQSGVELEDSEIGKMVSFLKTLTGEYKGEPVTTDNSRDHIHATDDDHHH